MSTLTESSLTKLFAAYNNANQDTVAALVDYLFTNTTTRQITGNTSAGLTVAANGTKLGFFGSTPITRPTVSSQVFTTPTDLPTAITQIGYLQTVVGQMRTALGSDSGLNLFRNP